MDKILLTGATGFIGSHILRLLVERASCEVICPVSEASSRWRVTDLEHAVRFMPIDYQSHSDWQRILEEHEISDVLHIGWSGVERAANQSSSQFDNYVVAMNLADLSVQYGCRSFISIGSQAEYGPKEGSISESESTNPATVYGIAKLAVFTSCNHFFRRRPDTRFVWLRVFSTYGHDDNEAWLLPSIIDQLGRSEVPALTLGEQQWDYLHVDDAAEAVLSILDHDSVNGLFNLGHGVSRSLRDYVEITRDAIDPSLPLGFGEIAYGENQVMHLEADISKLTRATGWRPTRDFEREIQKIVDFRLSRH